MRTREIIIKVIERIFPAQTNEIRMRRQWKRDAMQKMLDADRIFRENGYGTERINSELRLALGAYERGMYNRVEERITFFVLLKK